MPKIVAIETATPSHIMTNLLLVRIHTDDGLVGCGETYYTPSAIEAIIHDWMAERLIGAEATELIQELVMARANELTADEVGDLQAEGIQYYHRYIALYQLQDYQVVIRDTQRNLDMFDFVTEFAPNDELSWSVEQFTPYVRMMNTRAKASIAS